MSHSEEVSDDKRDSSGFEADVSDEVIRAALESVDRRTAKAPGPSDSPGVEIEIEGGAPAAPQSPSAEALAELQAQLDLSVSRARETMERLKDTHERHLRAAADLENYKKRAQREKEEAERFGIQKLLKELLPVMDNMDRALAHVTEQSSFVEGIQATRRIFEDTLGRFGVKSFSAVGEPFDPTRHEAMQQVPSASVPPGHVVSEMVRGYLLNDRLVRPALVAVSMAPPAPVPVAASEESTAAAVVPAAKPGEEP